MLRGINTGDAVLLLGGDLSVTVVQAQGLAGQPKSTHPFARVRIVEPFPTSGGACRARGVHRLPRVLPARAGAAAVPLTPPPRG